VSIVLQELHGGIIRRHFSSDIIVQNILDATYWWLTMNPNVYKYCQTYDQCQKTCNLLTQNLAKLVTTLPKKPFKKWGLDFIRPVKPISRMSNNKLCDKVGGSSSTLHQHYSNYQVLYKHILTRFGCPLTIVTDQSTHFINDEIRYLTDHSILRHTNSIVYYPQGNG
jgi:hypothetical protein